MIRVESRDEGLISVLFLNRPDQRNALTPTGLRQLADAAADVAKHAKVLVLAGDGKVFCAGFDLTICRNSPDGTVMRALLTSLSHAIATLRSLPIPVVAAAHGAAIAGGCAILGGADIVVGDTNAKYGYPVVRLGISPAVSAPFLRAAITNGAMRERLLNPSLISGTEAYRTGLVHELVDQPQAVLPRSLAIARLLATKPQGSLSTTKAWLNELDCTDDAEAVARALNVSLSLTGLAEERAYLPAAWTKDRS